MATNFGTKRKEKVIELIKAGKKTREIAKECNMSLRDVSEISKELKKPSKPQSNRNMAYTMLSKGKTLLQVATYLNIDDKETLQYYYEYLSLEKRNLFVTILRDNVEYLQFFIKVAQMMKSYNLSEDDITILLNSLFDNKRLINQRNSLQAEINLLVVSKDYYNR